MGVNKDLSVRVCMLYVVCICRQLDTLPARCKAASLAAGIHTLVLSLARPPSFVRLSSPFFNAVSPCACVGVRLSLRVYA